MKISIRGSGGMEHPVCITFIAQDRPDQKVLGVLAALGTIYVEDAPLRADRTPAVAERTRQLTFS